MKHAEARNRRQSFASLIIFPLLVVSGVAHAYDTRWGLLATPGWDQQAMKGVYFFPGEGACQASDYEVLAQERPVQNPNIPNDGTWPCHVVVPGWYFNSKFYTYTPSDRRDLHWNDSASNRTWVVNQIASTHANVIVMSRWGYGVNNGAPMQDTVDSNDQLFNAVDATGNILIMPAIDTFTEGGRRDFRTDFPGTQANPAPQLYSEVADLVARYLKSIPTWRTRWAQMYDRDGLPRYAINWIHAASTYNHNGCEFARGLDWIADKIHSQYGVYIGFTLDPFNAYQKNAVENFNCDVGYCPSPYNSCLSQARSFLGVQGFDSEIVRAGDLHLYPPYPADPWAGKWSTPPSDANDRIASVIKWKRDWIQAWINTGVPVIFDVSPGYDGSYVFPSGVIYGDNANYYYDAWRNAESELKGLGMKGTVYNAWNGYTEGLVATSGVWVNPQNVRLQDGRPALALKSWLTDYFSVDPRVCNHMHYVNFGQTKYNVYGSICQKWQGMNADLSVLGQPASSEMAGCNGTRRNLFQYGSIVYSEYGTYETHGLIGDEYRTLSYECSALGPPITDEQFGCNGHKRNFFQGGTIIYSSGAPYAHETHGAIVSKYGALGYDCGALGAPTSDELAGCSTDRRSYFESGAVVFSPSYGAFATYGLIGTLYRNMGYDCGWLGPPKSDEKACNLRCSGGRTNDFQNGHIDWCPGWPSAHAYWGPSGC